MASNVFKFGNTRLSEPYYTPAQAATFVAAKTIAIWTLVRQISLDGNEHHVAACLRLLVEHYQNADALFKKMRSKLQRRPPTICLFDYEQSPDPSVAVVDKTRRPDTIFVDVHLAQALEGASTSH